ncbi:hsp70-interacting protein, partial [Phenoliferia sp. Uapishka_3]
MAPPPLDPTQSLLRWGIENAAPGSMIPLHEDIKSGRRPDLNTDVLKAIMGTSDADRMNECVKVIQGKWVDRDGTGLGDKDVTIEDKLRAWDDLEMLIEDLDNANDLKFNGLWKPIFGFVTDENDEVALRACWVCGTAVQNNPRAQQAFLELDPLPTLLPLLTSSTISAAVRNKAMYCLSSTLKHSPEAVARFTELNGWDVLNKALQDPSQTLRTKTAFLLSQLISQSPTSLLPILRSSHILYSLLNSLSPTTALPTGPNGDVEAVDADYRDKGLRVIVNAVMGEQEGSEGLTAEERKLLAGVLAELEGTDGWSAEEDLGMSTGEWKDFLGRVAK